MSFSAILEAKNWAGVPFHFWTAVFFVFGSMVGSFLNVCIHRMPLGMSVVKPRSHCPHCQYSIPMALNIPIVTWLALRGKCAQCKAPISPRYLLVELLTGVVFAVCWMRAGTVSPGLAVAHCLILAGFIAATFIDFEHFIIPDEITIGGIVAGMLASLAVPELHQLAERAGALRSSFWGIAVGGGLLYGIVRGGKLLFGKERVSLEPGSTVYFNETSLKLPEREVPYEELFYRKSDSIALEASQVELADICYWNVRVRLTPVSLRIGQEQFDPESVPQMRVVTDKLVLPREAMGLGDVKFMAAIGAFLGWQAVVFTLVCSALVGSVVGLGAIAMGRKELSSRIPFGPYIALAAVVWVWLPMGVKGIIAQYLSLSPVPPAGGF